MCVYVWVCVKVCVGTYAHMCTCMKKSEISFFLFLFWGGGFQERVSL